MTQSISVACSNDYPPFSFSDRSGKLTGFHVEAITIAARKIGINVDVKCYTWPELIDLLQVNYGVDAFACGLTYTLEREIFGEYLAPWVKSASILVGKKGLSEVKSIAVNHGGYLESLARRTYPAEIVHPTTDNLGLPHLLLDGKVSHVLTDEWEFIQWENRELMMKVSSLESQRQGLFLKKRELADKMRTALSDPSIQSEILALGKTYGIPVDQIEF